MKTIIVGNGTSLLYCGKGVDIDLDYDLIVRLNNFKIRGYEHDVGVRTDVLFTCVLHEFNSIEKISRFPQVILCALQDPFNGVKTKQEVLDSPNIVTVLYQDYLNFVGVCADLDSTKHYPSTGLAAIHWFAVMKKHDVTITGFDHFIGHNPRYFEPTRVHPAPKHNGEKERLYVESLNIKRI